MYTNQVETPARRWIVGGVGPGRYAVGAHALGVSPHGGKVPLGLGLGLGLLPALGSRCAQALWAAWYWELLTPSCSRLTLGNPLANSLLLLGSGYFGTPWDRMQLA